MNTTTYENLKVFQVAVDLMVEVYRATETYPKQELYGLVSQMRRAAVSVVSHIGEGQGRLTFGEWRQMLSQGRGSLFELEAQLIASERLGFLQQPDYESIRARARDVGGKLVGLIRYVQRKEAQTRSTRKSPRDPGLTPKYPRYTSFSTLGRRFGLMSSARSAPRLDASPLRTLPSPVRGTPGGNR